MQMWNAIELIDYDETTNVDSYGDVALTENRTKVYAQCKSISQTEFYQAQTSGLKPEIKFVLTTSRDYNGQEEVVFNNIRYKVLKTFIPSDDSIEITCYGGVRENVSTENSH